MTETSPTVRISSMNMAWVALMPGPGSVAPSMPSLPSSAQRNRQARVAPSSWTMT